MAGAGPRGLEAVLVRPDAPGRYPLVLLNHGSPRIRANTPRMSPSAMSLQAMEFARRGWAAVIVMRRGYIGDSGGSFSESFGSCSNPDYVSAGRASADDLKAAIAALTQRPDIDGTRVVSVGYSAGGFATVALTADPPPGLLAGISFAGGRGSQSDDVVCGSERLVAAFATFGQRSRIPMLVGYAENDHYFGPGLAQKFKDAFSGAGGNVEFVQSAGVRRGRSCFFDGRHLGLAALCRRVPRRASPHAPDSAAAAPADRPRCSRRRSSRHAQSLRHVSDSGEHKAFAVSPDGHFGWRTGQRTVDDESRRA